MADGPKSLWRTGTELTPADLAEIDGRPSSAFDSIGWRQFADLYRLLMRAGIPPPTANLMELPEIVAVLGVDLEDPTDDIEELLEREGDTLAARAAAIRGDTPEPPDGPEVLTARIMREMGIHPPGD